MALGNESPKVFRFGVLEYLSQDFGFWSIIALVPSSFFSVSILPTISWMVCLSTLVSLWKVGPNPCAMEGRVGLGCSPQAPPLQR